MCVFLCSRQPTTPGSSEPGPEPAETHHRLLWILVIPQQQSITRYKLTALQRTAWSVWHARTHAHICQIHRLNVPFSSKKSLCLSLHSGTISSLSQVLLVMSSTAQRGSKSLPLPAILAPCWGQTEVLLHTAIKIFKAPWFKLQSKRYTCSYFFF